MSPSPGGPGWRAALRAIAASLVSSGTGRIVRIGALATALATGALCLHTWLEILTVDTALGSSAIAELAGGQESPFPHADHEGLFPVCTGCHEGILQDGEAEFYPSPSQCVGCHNGEERERVTWTGPSSRATNVVFDHVEHGLDLAAAGDGVLACESCHSESAAERMSVDESEELGTCWNCHAHERDEHFADEAADDCSTCHVPLAESGFDRARIESIETPAAHEGGGFLLESHAASVAADPGRCSTCHTSDQCVACHVDASLADIGRIPAAPVGMEVPGLPADYPEPPSHVEPGFEASHAPSAVGECSTCHTSDDCASCHLAPLPSMASSLPSRAESRAPGVTLEVVAPATHASMFFMEAHANLAAAAPSECVTCHTESYCVDCHDGPADGGYHPPDFVSQHPAQAFGRSQECATCHNTAAFCRECHQEVGLGSQGRLGSGYHDAEPLFLLRHGQAARQNLESCASCHRQKDCVQCHGTLGAFKVSPHTSDFDGEAAWARSPRTCLACHVSNPVGGGS